MTTAVSVENIRKRFARTQALDGVTLRLGDGVTGLLGPNGAGKTTMLRILATVLAPDDGRVRMLGLDPADPRERTELRRQLGYLPQDPGFQRGFSVFAFVDYMAILKEITGTRRRHEEVRRVIEAVDLTSVSGKRVRALSGGMRRRVALAAALLGDPACWSSTSRLPDSIRNSACGFASWCHRPARDVPSCCPPTRPRMSPRCAETSWS